MKIKAPGKLILSGEHAVVYGFPALAMAVNRYVSVSATSQASRTIAFNLNDFAYSERFSVARLIALKKRIKQKYERFIAGDFHIRDVIQRPVELAQIAFTLFVETLNLKLKQGLQIDVESTIPMGCGMGSSAATILSILHAMAQHLNVELPADISLKLGLEAENFQHGFSSGLDLKVSLYGGCLYIHEEEVAVRNLPTAPLFLVNTGLPAATTGECVAKARAHFLQSKIGDDFAAVTKAMDNALQQNNLQALQETIRANQILLKQIDVVPEKVQKFIAEVEKISGAAKVCGAGSVRGDAAGAILVITEDENRLSSLCEKYQYQLLPIAGETRGVHVI